MIKSEIICIGDELLIGQIVDTNSCFLAKQLNSIGISVFQKTSISDSKTHIFNALDEALCHACELIILTGGLGPTKDDITKIALCEYFDTHLVVNETVLSDIANLMSMRGLPHNDLNQKQAEVPANCTVIRNPVGTAPAMWFEKNGVIIVSLPGVPFEVEQITKVYLLEKLKQQFKISVSIIHKNILTFGLPESIVAERLNEFENHLPANIKLAYLPSPERLLLRLSAFGEKTENLLSIIQLKIKELENTIPEIIFGYDETTLPEIIGKLLKEREKNISTAESCTGGTIASLITQIAGSSEYYVGSVVAYSNEIKEKILKVKPENLKKFGAVSREVVEEMALGVRNLFQTDYAIATSGVAGPEGGSAEKPVGTIWIAVASKEKLFSQKFQFGILRDINIRRTAHTSLNLLRKMILNLSL